MKSTIIIVIIIFSVIVGMIGVIVFLEYFSNVDINIIEEDCATYWNNYSLAYYDDSIVQDSKKRMEHAYWTAEFFVNDCANSSDFWKHNAINQELINSDEWKHLKDHSWNLNHYQELKDPERKKYFESAYKQYDEVRKLGNRF